MESHILLGMLILMVVAAAEPPPLVVPFPCRFTNGVNISVPATATGDIYTALPSGGLVPDVFLGAGDTELRWVAVSNWTLTCDVNTSAVASLCSWVSGYGAVVRFEAQSLQSVARVAVNGIAVARSVNQFIPVQADVTQALCGDQSPPTATVTIDFESSVGAAAAAAASWRTTDGDGWVPDAPQYMLGLDYRNYLRTDQSSFGWDWGPGLAPVGVWGPMGLRMFKPCKPRFNTAPSVAVSKVGGEEDIFGVAVVVNVSLDGACTAATLAVQVEVSTGDQGEAPIAVADSVQPIVHFMQHGGAELELALSVARPRLWWPREMGVPFLHALQVQLSTAGKDGYVSETASWRTRIGFRTVSLITEGDPNWYARQWARARNATVQDYGSAPSEGPVMFFEVNGVPLFAKGCNVVPPEMLASRALTDPGALRLVDAIERGNMNMVRVWGGGRYLHDAFYDACDERGILVWQEMMFACAEYPDTDGFKAQVAAEVRHNVLHLARHPSIVLWSGNNEDGQAYDHGPASHYQRLNTDVILQTIATIDPNRPLWPSSPSAGFDHGVDRNGLPIPGESLVTADSADMQTRGDVHFYDYESCPDSTRYPRRAFVSEFGFQGYPRLMDLLPEMPFPAMDASSLSSSFMTHRQRHINGTEQTLALIDMNLRRPSEAALPGIFPRFDRATYLSQVLQALCMQSQVAFYRRGRSEAGRTMGALYWQLNQVWTAPSWASIEYSGRARLLHSVMEQAYHPLFVQLVLCDAVISSTEVCLRTHVSNDYNVGVAVELEWDVALTTATKGTTLVAAPRWSAVLAPASGTWAPPLNFSIPVSWHRNDVIVRVRIKGPASGSKASWPFVLHLAPRLKDISLLPTPQCDFVARSVAFGTAYGTVCCARTALWVNLVTTRFGWFSPNALTVFAGECIDVTYWESASSPTSPASRAAIERQPPLSAAILTGSVVVESLNDYWG